MRWRLFYNIGISFENFDEDTLDECHRTITVMLRDIADDRIVDDQR
ncbi:hypothetical protein AF72_01035 [Xylella taiwanensis]|uniref:Uncharacterized protein n=1 Tax=Xylella taiwanensis TaxID=1444770 RepID=Z9JM31_9GAMM|nr:hypothetical protein AF72_01035 [Xylella taiwanensis]